jgi:hypothetical protein
MTYQHRCDGMLTLETQQPIPQTLSKSQSSDLSALIAKDLHALLNIKEKTALVVCGAFFSSEQLLQPKFPIQQNINQYATAAFQGELNSDKVLSIGANNAQMPDGLQPLASQQSLLHLPFCLYTDDGQLAEKFETQLMHKGMISPPTYEKLKEQTQVLINHANYMTYLDLVAMMHNHFEQMGLTHLWQVIETALLSKDPKTAVISQTNNHFYLVDHLLFSPWFSWGQFASYFNTDDSETYIQWLMAQRLSLGAFAAHGLEIKAFKATEWPISQDKICLGQFEQQNIKRSFWAEQKNQPDGHPNHAVFYQHPQAGIVAISTPIPYDKISIYYPVTADGIAEIKKLAQQSDQHTTLDLAQHSNWLL